MTQNRSPQGNNPQTSDYSSTPGIPVSTRVHTIASLTLNQNRWQIRARVTQKSDIIPWKTKKGKGNRFSVELSDESGEIRATGFNDAVDKYYEMLEVDKIYFISKGTLKEANRRYNDLSNNYEMIFNAYTTVKLCNEEVELPSVKINELDSKTPDDIVEPAMPVTEFICSFKGFSDVYPSCKKLTHELARLFDKCEFDKEGTRRHTISFREATARLRTAVENSLSDVGIITGKKVLEFRIGKTSVTSQDNLTFDPMKPMTWGEVGGTNGKWREHKEDNYDGLIVVGCVTNELIPKVIKTTNTAIRMDHQMYALVMTQALVHHHMVQKPDGRLRNKSFDSGYCSEEKTENKGSIIYIAYKLETENISELLSRLVIKEEKQVMRCSVFKEEEQEIAESPPLLDDNASSSKLQSMPQEDQRFGTSTSSPVQGTSHEKNLEEANVSEEESEKGPKEEKIMGVKKNMTTNERKLILVSYKKLAISDDWDELAEEVYKERNQYLSRAMVKHYEYLLAQSKLKDRIQDFIHRVKRGTVGNETNQEIVALMNDVRLVQ